MSTRTTLLVANPTARTGKAARGIDRALTGLAAAGLEPEFFPTLPGGATVSALADRLERDDVARVVYLGGDGTFAESAKGIILARERSGVDVPLGMLPMGTANDQGRSFGISAGMRALADNIQTIVEGCEQWLDVGRIEALDEHGEVFRSDLWFDNCGFGLSARILAQRNRDRERVQKLPLVNMLYRDKLVYAGAAFSELFRSMVGGPNGSLFSCEVVVDGEVVEWVGLTDLVVNGTILYGGEWIFVDDAKADDGKFEVVPFRSHTDWVTAAIGSHKKNPVTGDDLEVVGLRGRDFRRGSHIEIRLFRPAGAPEIPGQIDGEEFVAAERYRVDNLFHHLRIIVPENAHWI
ncbi:diacylglycerol/lipid kinase family protein [Nannocystaceae bacterium ST9]